MMPLSSDSFKTIAQSLMPKYADDHITKYRTPELYEWLLKFESERVERVLIGYFYLLLQEKTQFSSSSDIEQYPEYQELMSFNKKFLTQFLINELREYRETINVIALLEDIQGDVIEYEKPGDVLNMADHWVAWAKKNGF